ncbi:MAG: NAD-dependent epimerase/dehydratase family protein [Saprospiraceae bacterium]|nr:NAD-dependent epimerase/dehydratase family protein [Saprospiraceae bacterium]
MSNKMILVTGANGQIGQVLTKRLRQLHGADNVLASDITKLDNYTEKFEFLDILNKHRLNEVIGDHKITQVYHLAAILSASGEWNPKKTWNVNLNGLLTMLTLAVDHKLEKVFFPSTIAVFGNTTPRINTPQHVPLLPETVYGMSKATGENWCNYFNKRYDLDVRSLRYPGIIGYQSLPGGGTTDYAVEIFYAALRGEEYTCFLNEDTRLPMMYMADALRGTTDLMEAPKESIQIRSSYNLAAMSFSPIEITREIQKHIPDFKVKFEPDFRQEIASSWTESIDDSFARSHWGWNHEYDLEKMVKDMLENVTI